MGWKQTLAKKTGFDLKEGEDFEDAVSNFFAAQADKALENADSETLGPLADFRRWTDSFFEKITTYIFDAIDWAVEQITPLIYTKELPKYDTAYAKLTELTKNSPDMLTSYFSDVGRKVSLTKKIQKALGENNHGFSRLANLIEGSDPTDIARSAAATIYDVVYEEAILSLGYRSVKDAKNSDSPEALRFARAEAEAISGVMKKEDGTYFETDRGGRHGFFLAVLNAFSDSTPVLKADVQPIDPARAVKEQVDQALIQKAAEDTLNDIYGHLPPELKPLLTASTEGKKQLVDLYGNGAGKFSAAEMDLLRTIDPSIFSDPGFQEAIKNMADIEVAKDLAGDTDMVDIKVTYPNRDIQVFTDKKPRTASVLPKS